VRALSRLPRFLVYLLGILAAFALTVALMLVVMEPTLD
jgi:hypothetical protein